jgi:hypothetical protein
METKLSKLKVVLEIGTTDEPIGAMLSEGILVRKVETEQDTYIAAYPDGLCKVVLQEDGHYKSTLVLSKPFSFCWNTHFGVTVAEVENDMADVRYLYTGIIFKSEIGDRLRELMESKYAA